MSQLMSTHKNENVYICEYHSIARQNTYAKYFTLYLEKRKLGLDDTFNVLFYGFILG